MLDQYRERHGLTMVMRLFYLDTFLTSPISHDYLNKMRHDLNVLESASFTVVLRFGYVSEMVSDAVSIICFTG